MLQYQVYLKLTDWSNGKKVVLKCYIFKQKHLKNSERTLKTLIFYKWNFCTFYLLAYISSLISLRWTLNFSI